MWGSTTGLATRQPILGGSRPGASVYSGVEIDGERWERIILHIDMDQFFCSVERRINPKLCGVPLVVSGSRKKRSVIAAASYEVRKYGIKAGVSLAEAKRLCPNIVIIPADIHRYTHALRQVVVIATRFTPLVEITSIDEVALDVTQHNNGYTTPREFAAMLRRTIHQELGLSCTIGVAQNKLMAKMVCNKGKPDGLKTLLPKQTEQLLRNLPTSDLPGIGDKVGKHLTEIGASTCGELSKLPLGKLRRRFGIIGDLLRMMGRGVDRRPIIPYWQEEQVKSIGNSITLPHNIFQPNQIDQVLLWLGERVGRRLRGDGYVGRKVMTVVRYPNFYTTARSHALQRYVDDGGDIYRCARLLLPGNILMNGVRMMSVSVSMLSKGIRPQHLFEQRRDRLNETLDYLNEVYGRDCCVRATLLPDLPGSRIFEEHFE